MRERTGTKVLEESFVAGLQARMRGGLVRPGDEGRDEAREVWNGVIGKRTAFVASCASGR